MSPVNANGTPLVGSLTVGQLKLNGNQYDNLIGTHQIVVTVTDGLNRSLSTSFSITGCNYPYSC